MWTPQKLVAAFWIGGVLGAVLDQIHVRYDVLWYPHPWLFGQAWWVVPLFGAATVTIASSAKWFSAHEEPAPDLTGPAVWFALAYWASGMFAGSPRILLAVFVVLFVLRTAKGPTRWFGVALAICGSAFESILSSTGAFHYRNPDFARIPWWLPGLYLHVAPLGLAVAAHLRRRR
jgi:hypothetical protein